MKSKVTLVNEGRPLNCTAARLTLGVTVANGVERFDGSYTLKVIGSAVTAASQFLKGTTTLASRPADDSVISLPSSEIDAHAKHWSW